LHPAGSADLDCPAQSANNNWHVFAAAEIAAAKIAAAKIAAAKIAVAKIAAAKIAAAKIAVAKIAAAEIAVAKFAAAEIAAAKIAVAKIAAAKIAAAKIAAAKIAAAKIAVAKIAVAKIAVAEIAVAKIAAAEIAAAEIAAAKIAVAEIAVAKIAAAEIAVAKIAAAEIAAAEIAVAKIAAAEIAAAEIAAAKIAVARQSLFNSIRKGFRFALKQHRTIPSILDLHVHLIPLYLASGSSLGVIESYAIPELFVNAFCEIIFSGMMRTSRTGTGIMKTQYISLFEFVERCGSQTQAAKLLKCGQPDINKHIKKGSNVQVEIIQGTNMPVRAEKRSPFGGLERLTDNSEVA
jgi:hypothetical protein